MSLAPVPSNLLPGTGSDSRTMNPSSKFESSLPCFAKAAWQSQDPLLHGSQRKPSNLSRPYNGAAAMSASKDPHSTPPADVLTDLSVTRHYRLIRSSATPMGPSNGAARALVKALAISDLKMSR